MDLIDIGLLLLFFTFLGTGLMWIGSRNPTKGSALHDRIQKDIEEINKEMEEEKQRWISKEDNL